MTVKLHTLMAVVAVTILLGALLVGGSAFGWFAFGWFVGSAMTAWVHDKLSRMAGRWVA